MADPAIVEVPRAQQRVWVADQLTAEPAAYLGGVFLRLHGRLDVRAVRQALTAIVTRHEVLRTSVVERDGELVGLLRPVEAFGLEVVDVGAAGVAAAIRAAATTPLNVADGLPVRARLLRAAADEHVLCVVMHHLAHDGASVGILYRELAYFYANFAGAAPADQPPPMTRQFREIAAAEEARWQAGELVPMLAERRSTLAGRSPFELPTDRPRPPVRSGAGDLCRGPELPAETVEGIARLAREHGATLFMVLLAACHAVLYRLSGRADVVTGTSSSTRRSDAPAQSAVGPFFNMIVIPGNVSGNPSFAQLLDRVRQSAMDAYESRLVPFDTLVSELAVDRDPAATPLFQILVDLIQPGEPPTLPGLRVEEILTSGTGSKYDLTVEFRQIPGGLGLFAEWDTALYEKETVQRLLTQLRRFLVTVAEDPGIGVDDVPLVDESELRTLQALAEAPPAELPDGCLHELVSRTAARIPDAAAIRDGPQTTTYADLDRRAVCLAAGLVELGVPVGAPVGVLLDRSTDMVVTVLGILRVGAAFVPIDTELPTARVAELLASAGATVCIVPAPLDDEPADLSALRAAVTDAGCRAVDVPALERRAGADVLLPFVRPDDLCAVYFTSGSTGVPKGVACTHRGWVSQMHNMQLRYELEPGEAILLKTPLSFDDVARELFWPLMIGAEIVVLPPGLHRDPQALVEAAIRHRLVWLQFVPSMLLHFLEAVRPEHVEDLRLRHLVSDGDRLRPETAAAFYERLGGTGCRLNNHWGTTEVSIDTTHHVCEPADCTGDGAVAVGRPMEHNSVYLMDRTMQPVAPGAVGELCIGGEGLARGYLGRPGATAQVFVPHPWQVGQRLYRTGDLGRLRSDGSLQYFGRRDHQVKIRGVRVELGEVETAIRAYPPVCDVVVDTWEAEPGDRRLIAYVTGAQLISSAVREFVAERLPSAAVPSAIVILPALPRMPSGKIDRRSLPEPAVDAPNDSSYVAPETEAECAVADIWAKTLAVPWLGVEDNFFAAGGHSLLVTRVVNQMRSAFAVDIPIRLVFEHPTVREAAVELERLVLADIEALTEDEVTALLADDT
jgi:amino acid adenylation domain-containing protein